MERVHPSAVIDPTAEVDETVEIGPYATVGPNVRLAAGVVLRAHSHVTGYTEIGSETTVFPFASIGEIPQDQKYRGEPTRLVVGERNQIREYVTMNPGTAAGGGLTSVGDDNLFMNHSHVAHDCHVGNHVIMSNSVGLAGHVRVEDYAVLAATSGVHQFVRVGESAMLGAYAGLGQDLAPYTIGFGIPARVVALNRINLERRGFSKERIRAVDRAFRIVFRSGLQPREAFSSVREELPDSREAEHLVAFLEKSERGFCRIR
jgi:UDP-N-acetylglucosamine acyltransferase